MTEGKFIKRELPVQLTEMELRDIGRTTALQVGNLATVQAEKKSSASHFKAQEEEINNDIGRLAAMTRNGYEIREVECEVSMDYGDREVTVTRTDTGEVVQRRQMTREEVQTHLNFAEKE